MDGEEDAYENIINNNRSRCTAETEVGTAKP